MRRSGFFAFAGLMVSTLLASEIAFAHHSFAMFDGDRVVVLRGTMLSFTFLNPHAWISVLVPASSGVPAGRWDVEATSTTRLASIGIQGDTFKAGDKLTVGIHPLKDGRRGGSMVFVVDSSGRCYGAKPEEFGLKLTDLKP